MCSIKAKLANASFWALSFKNTHSYFFSPFLSLAFILGLELMHEIIQNVERNYSVWPYNVSKSKYAKCLTGRKPISDVKEIQATPPFFFLQSLGWSHRWVRFIRIHILVISIRTFYVWYSNKVITCSPVISIKAFWTFLKCHPQVKHPIICMNVKVIYFAYYAYVSL